MKRITGIITLTVLAMLIVSFPFYGISVQTVKADTQSTTTVQLYSTLGANASLSNEKTQTSAYAAKLMLSPDAIQGSTAIVLYAYNKTFNTLQSFQVYTSYVNATPRFLIALDNNGDGAADVYLLSDYQLVSNGVWQLSSGGQRWGWSTTNLQLTTYGKDWNMFSYWQGIYGNATVLGVGVALEFWAVSDNSGLNQPLYADEVVINGVNYNIAQNQNQTPTQTVTDEWPMYRHDLQRSGASTSPASTGILLWKFTADNSADTRLRSSPTVVGGVAYVASNSNTFYALNATTGAVIWKIYTDSSVESSPAVVGGVIYVGLLWDGHNGYVEALNATNGALIWRFATNSGIESSPIVVNGVVYIGSYLGYIYALDATNGNLIWSYQTGSSTYSSPALVNGVLYEGSYNGNLYALNANSGSLIWTFQTGNQIYASPTLVNGTVYFNADNGNVYAVRATDGTEIWQAYIGSGNDHADGSPGVGNGIVYVGARNGFYAFNATTGAQLWLFNSPYSARQTTGYVYSSPAVTTSAVYIGFCDGYVFALNPYSGQMIWAFQTGLYVFASPAIVNGIVYVSSYDGNVYAIGSLNNAAPNPTPAPTPKPTATPAPTATPTATPDATAAPTAAPIQIQQPAPIRTPQQIWQPTSTPFSPIEIQQNQETSDNWALLAAIAIGALIAIASLIIIFKRPA